MFAASAENRQPHFRSDPSLVELRPLAAMSSCEILGIDAYAEDDLGYAPS